MPRAACKITEVPLICYPKSLARFVVSTDTGRNSRGGPFVVAWEEEAGQEEMSEAADGLGEQTGGIGQDGVKTKESSQQATWRTAGAMGLLALMAALAGGAALRESPTFDEVAHIGAGLSYADKLDSRFNPEHPPLGKATRWRHYEARRGASGLPVAAMDRGCPLSRVVFLRVGLW